MDLVWTIFGYLPVWAWVLVVVMGMILFMLYTIGTSVEAIRKISVGWRVVWNIFASPRQVVDELTPVGEPATLGDVRSLSAEQQREFQQIQARLDALLAAMEAKGEAPPQAAETRARRAEAAADIVTDPNPAAHRATEAFRAGRIDEAFDILQDDAEQGAAETAERWRRLGALANGIDTGRALEAYEAAFRLQPGDFWTCIELARLRQQAGNLALALQATKAGAAARTERERSVACNDKGNVLVDLGRLDAARQSFEAGLIPAQSIAQASPDNHEAQHDLSVSHNKIGDMQVAQGDYDAALQSFRASHAIFEHLAAADPGHAGWQRDLSVSHNRIGDVQVAQGDHDAALQSYVASLAIRKPLAAADPGNAGWQRDLIVSYAKLGGMEPGAGWWAQGAGGGGGDGGERNAGASGCSDTGYVARDGGGGCCVRAVGIAPLRGRFGFQTRGGRYSRDRAVPVRRWAPSGIWECEQCFRFGDGVAT